MQKYNLECPACEATYTLIHDMDAKSYKAEVCPFCVEEIYIEEDNEDEYTDEEWEDE